MSSAFQVEPIVENKQNELGIFFSTRECCDQCDVEFFAEEKNFLCSNVNLSDKKDRPIQVRAGKYTCYVKYGSKVAITLCNTCLQDKHEYVQSKAPSLFDGIVKLYCEDEVRIRKLCDVELFPHLTIKDNLDSFDAIYPTNMDKKMYFRDALLEFVCRKSFSLITSFIQVSYLRLVTIETGEELVMFHG